VEDIKEDSSDIFIQYLYSNGYNIDKDQQFVISFSPYKTKKGKTMAHIVMSDKDKNLTRAIAFSSMYAIALAKMREGMVCKPILKKLDDGTLMIKEIK